MDERLEAAYLLHELQNKRMKVYDLINAGFDESMTLQEILDQTQTEKDRLTNIITQ